MLYSNMAFSAESNRELAGDQMFNINNTRFSESQFRGVATLCFFWLAGVATAAHAYIDPGTGGFILQTLLAAFFSFIFVLKSYWTRIKNWFSGKPPESAGSVSRDAVQSDAAASKKSDQTPAGKPPVG